MMRKPRQKPASGDTTMGRTTFQRSPFPWNQCSAEGWDQIITFQSPWAAAKALPQRPPSRAWLELEGMAKYQVANCQTMAPMRAQTRISELTTFVSTSPDATVLATAVPISAPNMFVQAAIKTAWRG